jgi:hypothetical protein
VQRDHKTCEVVNANNWSSLALLELEMAKNEAQGEVPDTMAGTSSSCPLRLRTSVPFEHRFQNRFPFFQVFWCHLQSVGGLEIGTISQPALTILDLLGSGELLLDVLVLVD